MNKPLFFYYIVSGIFGTAAAITAIITGMPDFSAGKPEIVNRNPVPAETSIVYEAPAVEKNRSETAALTQSALISGSTAQCEMININTAMENELVKIKGIGVTKAKRIVEFRNENGPFLSVDDLINVPGIGQKTLDSIRDNICV